MIYGGDKMRQKGTLKYDIVIYLCLFVAFVCAIGSCIEPSSAVSEAPSKEIEKEPVVEETAEEMDALEAIDAIETVEE